MPNISGTSFNSNRTFRTLLDLMNRSITKLIAALEYTDITVTDQIHTKLIRITALITVHCKVAYT